MYNTYKNYCIYYTLGLSCILFLFDRFRDARIYVLCDNSQFIIRVYINKSVHELVS